MGGCGSNDRCLCVGFVKCLSENTDVQAKRCQWDGERMLYARCMLACVCVYKTDAEMFLLNIYLLCVRMFATACIR